MNRDTPSFTSHYRNVLNIPFNPEYNIGAYNAINVCLALQPNESFSMITDEVSLSIAASIAHAVENVGSKQSIFVLEDFGTRPMTKLPASILDAFMKSDVTIYACQTQPGELPHRMQMMEKINRYKPRHGHMVNINHQIMIEGMIADFRKIDVLSQKVLALASQAKRISARTKYGTEIEVTFNPKLKWLKTSGIISRDKWGNLPGGEVFTSPENINGVFIVDGVVGDYLCHKYGNLQDTPLTIEIENGRIKQCRCDNKELLTDFIQYCSTDENSDRIGEFAIGTNIALNKVIGHILQDEKLPGVHIAFGHPYSEHTGADWKSSTHIDVVGREFDIWIEDEQIMRDGKFLLE